MAETEALTTVNTEEIGVGSQSPFKDGAWLNVLRKLGVEAELLMIHRDPATLVKIWLKQLDEAKIDVVQDMKNRLDIPDGDIEKLQIARAGLHAAIEKARSSEYDLGKNPSGPNTAHLEALDALETQANLTTIQLIVNNARAAVEACRELQSMDNVEFRISLPMRPNFRTGEEEEDVALIGSDRAAIIREEVTSAIEGARREESAKANPDEAFLSRLTRLGAGIKIPGEKKAAREGDTKFVIACTAPASGTDAMPYGGQTGDGGIERTRRAQVLNPGLAVYVGAMENGIEVYRGGTLEEAFSDAVAVANRDGGGISILRTQEEVGGKFVFVDRPLIVLRTLEGDGTYKTSYCIGPGVQFPDWAIQESLRSKKEIRNNPISVSVDGTVVSGVAGGEDITPAKIMKGYDYHGNKGIYPNLLEQYPDNDPHSFFNMVAGRLNKDGTPESRLDMIAGFMGNLLRIDEFAHGLRILPDNAIAERNLHYTIRKVNVGGEDVNVIQDNRVTLFSETNLMKHILSKRVGQNAPNEREDCAFLLEKYCGLSSELAVATYEQALAFKEAMQRIEAKSQQDVLDIERITSAVKLLPAPKRPSSPDTGSPSPGNIPNISSSAIRLP